MSPDETLMEYHISKNRLEALVDAIFAFAMTILVLSIDQPSSIPQEQAAALIPQYVIHLFPQILLFVIAFFVLASFWLEHHRQFHFVRTVDPVILWLNIIILIFTVLLPFSTDFSGNFDHVQIAVVIFHLNLLVLGALFLLHWTYLGEHHHLSDPDLDIYLKKRRFFVLAAIPFCALIGIGVSFISPQDSFYSYLLIPCIVIIFLRKHHPK